MFCLETSVVVDFLRGKKEIVEGVSKLIEEGEVFITTISLCELYKGVYQSSKAEKESEILENFVGELNVLEHNVESCRNFGETYADLEKMGLTIKDFDLMIASIVKANDMILITRDKKHFENTGVKFKIC